MRLRTFGGLRIDGAPQGLGGAAGQPRPLALLLLLADAGARGVTRDKVAGYLWGESDREHSRSALRQTLYAVRRDLQQPEAINGTTNLHLNTSVLPADLVDFDEAADRRDDRALVELYSGPLADGFFLNGAPEFDRWLETARQTRTQQFAGAVRRLAGDASARGDAPLAIEYWRRLAVHDPLSSEVALQLIKALVDAGDKTSALEHARLHETMVREELGAPPDEAVLEVIRRLRTPPRGQPAAPGAARPLVERRRSPEPFPEFDPGRPVPVAPIVGAALPAASPPPEARPRRAGWVSRHRAVFAASILIVVSAIGAAASHIVSARHRPDPALVAVAPYQAFDSTLAFWREGMMDLLAHALDRAGPLRAVAPLEAARQWSGLGGRQSARELGERTNAAVVVYGQLTRAGHDSVYVVTSVLHLPTGETVTVQQRASLAHMDRLIDSVAMTVVQQSVRWMAARTPSPLANGTLSVQSRACSSILSPVADSSGIWPAVRCSPSSVSIATR